MSPTLFFPAKAGIRERGSRPQTPEGGRFASATPFDAACLLAEGHTPLYVDAMPIEVNPSLEDGERRALLAALELVGPRTSADDPYRQAWRTAALREAVDDEDAVGYALSPRSTRGATRA
jgi:hypothetical protein